MTVSGTVRTVRATWTARRSARRRRRQLVHDLSCFTGPDDLLELESLLARHTDTQTAELRQILGQRSPNRTRVGGLGPRRAG